MYLSVCRPVPSALLVRHVGRPAGVFKESCNAFSDVGKLTCTLLKKSFTSAVIRLLHNIWLNWSFTMSVMFKLYSYTKLLYDLVTFLHPLSVTNNFRAGSNAALIGVDLLFTLYINRLGR